MILHHNVAQDTELSNQARTLADELVQSEEDFALDSGPSPFQPETCLTAMYFANSVYVKSLADEYPDFIGSHIAQAHAGIIRHFAEHFEDEHPDQETAQLLRDAADHLQRLCNAELQGVSPRTIRDFIERTASASGEPDTVRKAALAVSGQDPRLAEWHTARIRGMPKTPTTEQAETVLGAARQAGMTPGALRELCRCLGADPAQHGVPPVLLPWEELEDMLDSIAEADPERNDAAELIRLLGNNPDSPEAREWLEDNTYSDEELLSLEDEDQDD